LALLDAHPGENVLDIGPGTGHSLAALSHSVGKAGRVEALDLSPVCWQSPGHAWKRTLLAPTSPRPAGMPFTALLFWRF